MTNLTIGDTVIAKHNNIWTKGCITKINSHPYYPTFYITFDKESVDTLYIPYNRSDIIKVGSDFNMGCFNCKHGHKLGNDEPCYGCLSGPGGRNYYWEPCDSLKNKGKLYGNDMKSFYPNFYVRDLPKHPDYIDALRYYINDVKACAEFMADFNKKENKNMKKQQKKRDRNIIKVKDLETRKIKEIMFNGPTTIIKWDPTWKQLSYNIVGDKTVTVCKEPDKLDKTTGFLLAVLKEILDNQSYGNILEKIDEINEFDELSKQTVEADLESKHNNKDKLHCSIKDLTEATEALENVYVPGSVVKYKYGKKYYMVCCYRFDEDLKEMVYVLRPYRGTGFADNTLEYIYKRNIPHSKLIKVRRK